MKKRIAVMLCLVLTLSTSAVAFAHGCCGGGGYRNRHTVANCTNPDHTHYYNGEIHNFEDCTVEGHCHS